MPFINVYLEDRACGGPEEGGWYYSTGDLCKTIPVTTHKQAERAMRLINRWLAWVNKGRPSIGSVMSRGRFCVRVEREPGKSWPAQRPIYE